MQPPTPQLDNTLAEALAAGDAELAAALQAALADGSWCRYEGRHGEQLVAALRELLGVEHVYPVCSGTFAVELALRMLKVGPGDEVVLGGYDFAGNYRAIEAVGATPVLVDIVPRRWHVDPVQLEAAASPQVKAVIVSHLHGVLAPMREIAALADRRGWQIVEDACQAPGAIVDGRRAGTWGHVGTLSFGGSKLLTAGRGGAVTMREATLLQRAKVFCERGNHAYPLSELQAALLLPQLRRLDRLNRQRHEAVERVRAAYAISSTTNGVSLLPAETASAENLPAYYKLGWLLQVTDDGPDFRRTHTLRMALIYALQAAGIAIDSGFRGFSRRAARCHTVGSLTAAEQAAAGTLVLHHSLLLQSNDALDVLGQTLARLANQSGDRS